MKVIFLDFDGVLNSAKYLEEKERFGFAIDPARMVLLKQIVDATDAKIVLSTSWREHWSKDPLQCDSTGEIINSFFSEFGLQIFDKTPELSTKRENEIRSWLDTHTDIEGFVILDDRILFAEYLNGHFVKTSGYFEGLDETDVQDAIWILTNQG